MLPHPLINSLFNDNALIPSKQLQMVRSHLRNAKLEPYIVIILPPLELLMLEVDSETFYHDTYLLSHIAAIDWKNPGAPLLTFNGGNWMLDVTETQVIPAQNFPAAASSAVNITSSRMWTPGLTNLRFNGTFLILEVDGLLLTNDTPRRFSIFTSPAASIPAADTTEVHLWTRSQPLATANEEANTDEVSRPRQTQNPASELGRTKAQRDQNMAKVDYSLACLRQDVASAEELAKRFHDAVFGARHALVDAGANFDDSVDSDEPVGNGLSTRMLYEYAESQLARYILEKLDDLLARERQDVDFVQIQEDLKSLDLSQVDVPGLDFVKIDAYERAIAKAAKTLDRLNLAHNSEAMAQVFLQSLKELADPRLGTVSADTLLGLFMLTVLRSSPDTATIIERSLYFVVHFSFRATGAENAQLNAGRLSYTLMVVESVLLQLRMDRKRLAPVARLNTKVWHAVETNNRDELSQLFEKDNTSLKSRKAGNSVLFLATIQTRRSSSDSSAVSESRSTSGVEEDSEDHEKFPMLAYLFQTFPSVFTRDFVLRDRDMQGRTLLMAALHDETLITTILGIVGEAPNFYAETDIHGRNVAHLLSSSNLPLVVDRVGHLLSWTQRDHVDGDTPLLALARRGLLDYVVQFCENFYDHIDPLGNSLLHIAVNSPPELLIKLLTIPSCDINWANKKGFTPLMVAILESSIELLLQAGANAWYFDSSDTEQTSSPALRRSLYSQNSNNPVIQNSHRPDERLLFQPASTLIGVRRCEDFQTLNVQLRTMFPFSWLPRLEWLYRNLENISVGHHFFGAFLWDDTFRIGYWLRLIQHHGTFQASSPVLEFCSSSKQEENSVAKAEWQHNAKQSALDREEVNSITSFCRFSIEQLSTLETSIKRFTRGFLAVQEIQDSTAATVSASHRELCSLGKLIRSEFKPLQLHRAASSLRRETVVVLDQVVKSTEELQHSLVRPIALTQELDAAKGQLVDSREKLQVIAENKSAPSWLLPRLEAKRVAEIQALEDAVGNSRKRVNELELDIRETHFALASELSAFNSFQENEVLEQIGKYAQDRLQAARDDLRRFEYGFLPRRKA